MDQGVIRILKAHKSCRLFLKEEEEEEEKEEEENRYFIRKKMFQSQGN